MNEDEDFCDAQSTVRSGYTNMKSSLHPWVQLISVLDSRFRCQNRFFRRIGKSLKPLLETEKIKLFFIKIIFRLI